MRNLNIEEITTRIRNVISTNVLSFKTLRNRLNDGKTKQSPEYLTSNHLIYVLSQCDKFAQVDPIQVGSSKWFPDTGLNKQNTRRSYKVKHSISLWEVCS
jgi:hypothetical protein